MSQNPTTEGQDDQQGPVSENTGGSPRPEDNPEEQPDVEAVQPDAGDDPSAASQWDSGAQ